MMAAGFDRFVVFGVTVCSSVVYPAFEARTRTGLKSLQNLHGVQGGTSFV
jgi:hypothetical protein